MTTNAPENALSTLQAALPFAPAELLRVRVLPAEFARMLGVNRSTVSRWISRGTITPAADGRVDPQRAMRQLLRHGNPGQLRARLVRQAFGDLADLRAEAARATDLERQLHALGISSTEERAAADADYGQLLFWLQEFERRVVAIPQDTRGILDERAWKSFVAEVLRRAMGVDEWVAEIDRQIGAGQGSVDSAPVMRAGGGGNDD
jgi:hypothetical protein